VEKYLFARLDSRIWNLPCPVYSSIRSRDTSPSDCEMPRNAARFSTLVPDLQRTSEIAVATKRKTKKKRKKGKREFARADYANHSALGKQGFTRRKSKDSAHMPLNAVLASRSLFLLFFFYRIRLSRIDVPREDEEAATTFTPCKDHLHGSPPFAIRFTD